MRNGFSLIELLVVIAIMGILSALMLPNFFQAQTRGKEAAVRAVALALQHAIESYNMDHGTYLAGTEEGVASLFAQLSPEGYLKNIPNNAFTGQPYGDEDSAGKIAYTYEASNGTYALVAYKRDGQTILLTLSNA